MTEQTETEEADELYYEEVKAASEALHLECPFDKQHIARLVDYETGEKVETCPDCYAVAAHVVLRVVPLVQKGFQSNVLADLGITDDVFLPKDTKIVRVTSRRRDLGCELTESMIRVDDLKRALALSVSVP